jgi:hypothetical protein
MSKINPKAYVGLSVLVVLLMGCDSTSEPAPLPGPIIVITNAWLDDANSNHVFNFESNDDGESEGTFEGFEVEDVTVFGGEEHELTGSWANGRVEFTVDRNGVSTTYEATFTEENPDRLSFTAGSETLVLVKENPS